MDYNKLVAELRETKHYCDCCKFCLTTHEDAYCSYGTGNCFYSDAADAIEALISSDKRLRELLDNRNKDVDELQRKVEELTSRIPKRGEWKTTDAFPHRVYCSNCFRTYIPNDRWQIWVDKPVEGGLERNYCPSCGAKMEAQE